MFLPEFDDLIKFEQFTANNKTTAESSNTDATPAATFAQEETIRAAKNLDGVVNTLVTNFGEGSDYFKVLVKVFQEVLLTAENDHLKVSGVCMCINYLCIYIICICRHSV